jgi:hypothetical protein
MVLSHNFTWFILLMTASSTGFATFSFSDAKFQDLDVIDKK